MKLRKKKNQQKGVFAGRREKKTDNFTEPPETPRKFGGGTVRLQDETKLRPAHQWNFKLKGKKVGKEREEREAATKLLAAAIFKERGIE